MKNKPNKEEWKIWQKIRTLIISYVIFSTLAGVIICCLLGIIYFLLWLIQLPKITAITFFSGIVGGILTLLTVVWKNKE
jgi:hypothetical protein